MADCAKKFWGGRKQTESTGDFWSKLLDPFVSSSERLVTGIFVKIKPNFL